MIWKKSVFQRLNYIAGENTAEKVEQEEEQQCLLI